MVEQKSHSILIGFEVSDTGIGIAADKINLIFDNYTQASSDTARKYGGTGLGLAITKSLIELHNSSIYVESEIGKGSIFKFTIEFELSDQKILSSLHEISTASLNATILVVDDNQINRILAKKVLSKWGIKVDFAENGAIALEQVKNTVYDVVLMDLQMPEMDGFEATKAIRKLEGDYYRNLPIIALTASIVGKEKEKIYASGMNDYVMKPFVPSVLYSKINSFLKKTVN